MIQTALLKSIVSKQTITLLQTQSISTALNTMSEFSISSIIIVDDEKHPIGIFTEHDALRIISNELNTGDSIENVMTKDPFCVDESMLIHDAYMLMEERKFRHLILIDKAGCFIGVVTEGDFLRHLGFENLSNSRVVQDVMSDAPLIINQSATLAEAVTLMQDHNCEYAIVLKDSAPVGIITERDIVQHYANVTTSPNETIEKMVHHHLVMINQSTSLQKAAELMEHHNIHQLIVLNNNKKLIGVLSRHDVLRAIHGAYFEFLVNLVDQKSTTIALMQEQTQKIKNNQELIEKQRTFLNTIINTIPDLLWLKDMQGRYLLCNEPFECFFGAKESAIIGKTDFDFVDAELAEFFRKNDRAAIEAGGTRTNEEYLVFADGSYEGYFDTTKMPMYDKEGNTVGVLGVAHDISERKSKDDEITQVQALSHIGTWEWDIDSNTFTGSKESYRIYEIPYGKSASLYSLSKHVFIEDRERYMMEKQRQLKEKTIHEMIYRIQGNDKKIRWVKSNGEFKYDSKGNAVKAIGIVQDITEHMEHEYKLETLANYDSLTGLANRSLLLSHLQKTIDSSKRHQTSIALIIFDLDRFKDVNDSFGHSAGDELLQLVAERFTLRLREDDFVARLGGDEFAIVMNNFSHP